MNRVIGATITIALIAGCHDEPSIEDRVAERIVVTQFDPGADFTSFATFALPDSVTVVTTLDAGTTSATLDPAVAAPFLDELATQLTSRGYTRVARTARPDLGVAVTALELVRVESVAYGDWARFGSAPPSFWGYPGVPVVSSFGYVTAAWQSGTIIVELEDLRVARAASGDAGAPPIITTAATTQGDVVSVAWAVLIHGVFRASPDVPPAASLDQAFVQSPYLHR